MARQTTPFVFRHKVEVPILLVLPPFYPLCHPKFRGSMAHILPGPIFVCSSNLIGASDEEKIPQSEFLPLDEMRVGV